jgi:signal transduction histidine kinase
VLYEFIDSYREAIMSNSRKRVKTRSWPPVETGELENGVPTFLTQLAEILKSELSADPVSSSEIGFSATLHAGDLFALGFTVSQVVHDYGDICQAITEVAIEKNAPITTQEFHTLNRCLDIAIADAVTEHARITSESRDADELERVGGLTHEIRDMLNTAILALAVVKAGTVGLNGHTGAVLGRSLTALRALVETELADIRLKASHYRPEKLPVMSFINDIAVAAQLQADYSQVAFAIEPVNPALTADIDRQLLTSAVMNLLNNAFKYTPAGGRVILRTAAEGNRVLLEVEDTCGGIPEGKGDVFQPFGERRGKDRTGLGLGLSIARKAVRAQGGDIHVHNMPGKGCIFVIEVPMAVEAVTSR